MINLEKYSKYFLLFLIIITTIVFSPTFFNDFQRGWDDQWQVLDYEFVTQHSFSDLVYYFTHFHLGQYFPVNTLLYIVVYELFGFNPAAFHTACLLFHVFNVLLVYLIICQTIGMVKPVWNETRSKILAFLTALIFAIHPLQVESVAWISASKIVLYAFFFLCGIWFFLRYLTSKKIFWLTGCACCYLLSFGSKEQAIIFPLNLFAFDYMAGRFKKLNFTITSLTDWVIIEKLPFFAIALFLYCFSLSNNLGTFDLDTYPFHQRLFFGMSSLMDYVFRFIAPVKLYYFYFFPINHGEFLPAYFLIYPVLVLICVLFVWNSYKKNNRLVVFGSLLFFINIVLVLHVIPMPRAMITADRYMYFSIIGVGLVFSWLICFFYRKIRTQRNLIFLLFSLWLLFLGCHSFFRTREWKDSDAIKKNVTELIEKRRKENKPVINNPLKNNPDGEK